MKHRIFVVFDKAVGAFLPPVYVRSTGEMLRSFTATVNTVDHQFFRHAGDYTLFQLGEWDDQTGLFECGEPLRVVSALEVLESEGNLPEAKRVS